MLSHNWWKDGIEYLSDSDATLRSIIESTKEHGFEPHNDAFLTLARAIIGQQISVKAANSVWNKMENNIGNLKPQTVSGADDDLLRLSGVSPQKIKYLRSICDSFLSQPEVWCNIREYDDEFIMKNLLSIKGVGQWTAEMFMIFYAFKPDIFPLSDLGLAKAIKRLYSNTGVDLTHGEMSKIGERWKPYRTVATWYLWRSLEV